MVTLPSNSVDPTVMLTATTLWSVITTAWTFAAFLILSELSKATWQQRLDAMLSVHCVCVVTLCSCGNWRLVNLCAHLVNTPDQSVQSSFIRQNTCWLQAVLTSMQLHAGCCTDLSVSVVWCHRAASNLMICVYTERVRVCICTVVRPWLPWLSPLPFCW